MARIFWDVLKMTFKKKKKKRLDYSLLLCSQVDTVKIRNNLSHAKGHSFVLSMLSGPRGNKR